MGQPPVRPMPMQAPAFNFPVVGPPVQQATQDVLINNAATCHCCCIGCGGGADDASLVAAVQQMNNTGFIARATENKGYTQKGNCGSEKHDEVWYETGVFLNEAPDGFEVQILHMNVQFDTTMNCCGPTVTTPDVNDITAMQTHLAEQAQQGWALGTIYDSPSTKPSGCNKYISCYVAVMYRARGTALPRQINLLRIMCPGVEQHRMYGHGDNRHWELEKRDMNLTAVEQAIYTNYSAGWRIATVVDVEGGVCPHPGTNVPCQKEFFLFFERFADPSVNQQRYVHITTGSRVQTYGRSCCEVGQIYDSSILRTAWQLGGQAGWRIAEMFDTNREQGNRYSHSGLPNFKDSMLIFESTTPPPALQAAPVMAHPMGAWGAAPGTGGGVPMQQQPMQPWSSAPQAPPGDQKMN